MAFLRDVSNRFWNYVSPRKTLQRRDKEFKVPAIPVRPTSLKKQVATPKLRAMSPQSRVKNWSVRTPSPQSDVDGDMDMDPTLLPPSPPASANLVDDFEGDTLIESPGVQTLKRRFSSADEWNANEDTIAVQGLEESGSSGDEWNANEDTIAVDDGNYLMHSIDVDKERKRRDKQGRELREAGWSEDAVFLFQKLGMRGFEPLLPIEWLNDLETLPEDLFTSRLDKAFLRPAHGSGFRAQQALSSLFDLGGRVCDAKVLKAPKRKPEYHIKRAVQKYASWAMKDGEVDHIWPDLPLFKIVTWPKTVHSTIGEREMIQKLGDLHKQWSDALQNQETKGRLSTVVPDVPTLYGVTASHTVMAFVSYAPPTEAKEEPQLRLIAMFDFGKEGYDVWHALAIAIFITHCRNRMMQLKDILPEPEHLTEEDPDL